MLELESTKNQRLSATTLERGSRSKLNLLHDSDFGIGNKKEISKMADFVKNDKKNYNNNGKKNFNNRNNNNRNNKSVAYNNSKRETIPAPDVCAGTIEYKMSKVMADEILKAAKSKSGKLPKPPLDILCDYVNTQMGLKGYCVKVLVDIN
jgi:hypothetical protein